MRRGTLLDFFQDFAELPNDFLIYDDGFHSRVYRYNEVAAKARGFAAFYPEYLILLAFGAVYLVAASMLLRKQEA